MHSNQETYKKSKWKAFVFFLFMAVFFWVLTKFSRQYTSEITASIKYRNVPENVQIGYSNPAEVDLEIEANGFEFLYFSLKNPTLFVDIAPYHEGGGTKVAKIPKEELLAIFTTQLGKTVKRTNIPGEQFEVELDVVVVKMVPVKAQADLVFKEGFQAIDSLYTVPDSVKISGPSVAVNDIDSLQTAVVSGNGIASTFSTKARVLWPDSLDLEVFPKVVEVRLQVAEFSQKTFRVPISVVNLPPGITIKLIPEMVDLTFNAPIAVFNEIKKQDFRIECDFAKRNTTNNFMIPRLVAKHPRAVDIELDEQKIDFLIFK